MRFPTSIALVLTLTGAAAAHEVTAGDLVIGHPWSRTTPATAKTGVGYLTVTNNGSEPDRLVGGSADVSAGFTLHTSKIVDGVARMRPLEGGLPIAPGETISLKPGATHVMLTGMKKPILEAEPFAGTLVFEKAGSVPVEFTVEGFGGRPAEASDSHLEKRQ